MLFCTIGMLNAQTTVLDFETDATSAEFEYFGSGALDGTKNNILANPDASGINTSATVGEIIKPAGAQLWAGCVADSLMQMPDLITVDLTTDTDVCMHVWMAEAGNVMLKLEDGDQGNWEQLQEVSTTGQWVEVCYNTLLADGAGSGSVAAGGTYKKLVLFFNFGDEFPPADKTMYFDNIEVRPSAATVSDLTLSVDMNDYANAFTTVYVTGDFNNWGYTAMTDADMNGVWEGTVAGLDPGAYEYKFAVDNGADTEMLDFSASCLQNGNRFVSVSENTTQPTVCWNSCYTCGASVMITFNLGEAGITVDPAGLFIAGGGNFGVPGDNPMSDPDMDGIHTITFEKEMGFSSYFTFTNGACSADWSCKEQIAGMSCSNPDNFDDRLLNPVMQDTIYNTCFGQCTETTDCAIPNMYDLTLKVDMNDYADAFTTVYASGMFNGWSADANPLDDSDMDGVWETTISVAEGDYFYKFQLDGWVVQEGFDANSGSCVADNNGNFDRWVSVTEDTEVCFDWSTCDACSVTNGFASLDVDKNIFTIQPTLVDDQTVLTFGDTFNDEKIIRVFNSIGQSIRTINVQGGFNNYVLNTSTIDNGFYFINVETEGKIQTSRIVINH